MYNQYRLGFLEVICGCMFAGKTEELIGATLFLTNEEAAAFVNGVVLPIDGGFSAYSGV